MALDQQRLNPDEQRLAGAKIREDNAKAASDLRQNNISAANDLRQNNNIAQVPSASQAETMAQGQGRSLKELYNNAKQVPQKLRDLKQDRDTESGRLGFKKDGLSTIDIDNSKARQEKFGSNAQSMSSLNGDLYRRAKAAKKKQGSFNKLQDESIAAAQNAISMATSNLLQKSWLNAIDSYGLTVLLYVNFHVFCRFVFGPKVFCKLGHEWLDGKGGGGAAKATGATKAAGASASSSASKSSAGQAAATFFGLPLSFIGIAEAGLLALVDALIVISLLITAMPFIILAIMSSGSLEDQLKMTGLIFEALWEAAKALFFPSSS